MTTRPPFRYQPVRISADGDDERSLRADIGNLVENDGYGPAFDLVEGENGSKRKVQLTREQRIDRFNRNLFSRAFYEDRLRTENEAKELLPYRVRAAYRIVKEMAKQKNMAHHEESLAEALIPREMKEPDPKDPTGFDKIAVWNPDPWTIGTHFDDNPSKVNHPTQFKELPPLFLRAADVSRVIHGNNTEVGGVGVALMPPPIPKKYMIEPLRPGDDPTVSASYDPDDPHKDPLLHLWLDMVDIIVLKLGIRSGTINDPDFGAIGLMGILEPKTVRECWPTRTQLIMWESILVEEALDLVLKGTATTARKELEAKYGFNQRECQGLLRQANTLARHLTTGDREDTRAIMILRLEEYCRRSREALDLRSELKGMQQLSIITGLSDATHNDPMTDFLDAVRQVSRDKKIAGGMNALKALAERKPVTPVEMFDTSAREA